MIAGLLRGLGGVPPWMVGLARGVVEAAVMAGLVALALTLTNAPPAAIVPYTPLLLVVIRYLEGIADNIDPAKRTSPEQ